MADRALARKVLQTEAAAVLRLPTVSMSGSTVRSTCCASAGGA